MLISACEKNHELDHHGQTATEQSHSHDDGTGSNDDSVEAIDVVLTTNISDSTKNLLTLFGPWPQAIPADPGNELSGQAWAEQLGELLFNDSALSSNGQFSCATCHIKGAGFDDEIPVAIGLDKHTRNTQGLLNVGLQRWFGWDGGADSLWAASLRPLLSDIEMGATIPEVAAKFRSKDYVKNELAKASRNIEPDSLSDEEFVVMLSKAIAAYSRTLTSGITPFDRYRQALLDNDIEQQAQYPDAAKRGLNIFFGEANCHVCHFGPNFSNGEFHDTGRPFFTGVGQVDSGRYTGIQRVKQDRFNLLGAYNARPEEHSTRKTRTVSLGQTNFGQWRTPSLRSLSLTAPYMHDGSLGTLRDVVDAYADIDPQRLHSQGESILKPLNLNDGARNDLVRFLETLSE